MATIKSYTDIKQSKKLAEILPIESADMSYIGENNTLTVDYLSAKKEFDTTKEVDIFPCWSLAALLEQLHYEVCDDDGYSTYLQINKDDDMYQLIYEDPSEILESIETDRYEHFVDACVAMIEKLHKLKLI